MIPDHFIEQLKYANPIEDVIATYVTLKRQGRNLKGLCPFHSEKTPSFVVYPDDQNPHYHCFGCGSGGDVITFIRNIENAEYIEAIKLLAARAGMTVPEDGMDDPSSKRKGRMLELNRVSARFFHQCLKADIGKPALGYLMSRGLSAKTIKRFGIGYAPSTWDSLHKHLRENGFSDEDMVLAAVVSKRQQGGVYDSFRNRVMFPIIDLRGNVIAFGGRALEDRGPKYLNTADTPVFKKSRNLFALNFAKASHADEILLAEGYMDVIAMHQAGFDSAVATLGTALTAEQSRLIAQYTKKVSIAYDSDAAGQAATKRAINLLGEVDVQVSVLEMQGAKDPDEFIRQYGAARFQNLIQGGKNALVFEIDKLRSKFDLESATGKSAFLQEFCKFMAGIEGDVQRDVYISEMARELSVSKEPLIATIQSLRKKHKKAQEKRFSHNLTIYAQDKSENRIRPQNGGSLSGYVAEQKLITLLLSNPDAYDAVKPVLSAENFAAEDHRTLYRVIAQRLEAHQSLELIYLSAQLSPPQIALLTRLMESGQQVRLYAEQALTYAHAIRRQHENKTPEEIAQMDPLQIKIWLDSQK